MRFTSAVIEMKPPKSGRAERRDDISPLWLRVTSTGDRSFAVRVRVKGQSQPIRLTYPKRAHISNLSHAREWALQIDERCRAGHDPRTARHTPVLGGQTQHDEKQSFERVAAAYLATNGAFKKNSRGWKPRTYDEYERAVNQRLVPRWTGRAIHSITRDEISDYLDEIAETAPVAANRILAVLSGLMSWYQAHRGSGFTSPIVRGMEPTQETARDRILSDTELRLVWHVAGKAGTFGRIVRMLLLTGARKSEVAAMRHSQIGPYGIWALPGELTKNREPLYLPLSADALAVIAAQTRLDEQDIVFSIGGTCEFKNWGHNKAGFDKRIIWRLRAAARVAGKSPDDVKPLPNWRLHDLRRTARSLMARAKVRPDHAERVLNHRIGGVEGTYDRHSYEDEKRAALERLADMVRKIVSTPDSKVVRFVPQAAAA